MTDISQMTWKYLHGPDDVAHLSFQTGGVPRSFSVLQYSATEHSEIDFKADGLAIIDNDYMAIVLDQHLQGAPDAQARDLLQIRKLTWDEFSTFCVEHPRYRSKASDMTQACPDSGVLVNQIRRGVLHAPTDENDLRSPSMVEANAQADCPYQFPATTRQGMIKHIMDHDFIKDEDGVCRIAWECHFDSQVPATGGSDESNLAWLQYYEGNPEIFYHIAGALLEPYFIGLIGTWPDTDKGRYNFKTAGVLNADTLCLSEIDGADLGFKNKGDLGIFLDALEDAAIRDVWKLIQVVDHRLSEENVEARFTQGIAEARVKFESDREADPDFVFA